MAAHRKRKVAAQPLSEPHVRFLRAHSDINRLCRVGAGALWYVQEQVRMLGPGLLRSCVDRAGQAWRRISNFGDEFEAVGATKGMFARMAVTLQNPVYLDSREKIGELFGYLPDGSENKTAYPELREKLVNAGYDGLIVSAPHNQKLVRNAFGVSQVIVFGKRST